MHARTQAQMHSHPHAQCPPTAGDSTTDGLSHSECLVELLDSMMSSQKSAEQSVIGCFSEQPFIIQLHTSIFTILQFVQ